MEDDILIERFLNKELSKEEEVSFFMRIEKDSDFKEAFLLEQQLSDTLNDKDWSFVKNIDNHELNEYENLFRGTEAKKVKKTISLAERKYKNSKNFKRIMYSSAAVLVLVFSILMYNSSKAESLEELYAYHIEQVSLPSYVNRNDNAQNQNLIKAQALFDKKEYQKSIVLFSNELGKSNTYSGVYLHLATAQIEINQFKEAEITLDNLIKSDFIDAQKGYWLKGLLYLKSKKPEEAKKILQVIIENSFYKEKEASVLLKQIQNLNK